MITVDVSTALSIVAVLLSAATSILTIYLQFFRVHDPHVHLLNDGVSYRTVLRTYGELPQIIRDVYSKHDEPNPYYAQVDLEFINSGDRTGYVRIVAVVSDRYDLRTSFYNYTVVAPGNINNNRLVLRNIPEISEVSTVNLAIEAVWGGISRRSRQFRRTARYHVPVNLHPSQHPAMQRTRNQESSGFGI